MKVILDWVANHASRDAVWVEAHPDWYVRDSLGELNVMYDWTDIAQLDYSKPEMREAMMSRCASGCVKPVSTASAAM